MIDVRYGYYDDLKPKENPPLNKLQEALLVTMFRMDLMPNKPFCKCKMVFNKFISMYEENICDSISEIKHALYELTHDWKYQKTYAESQGNLGYVEYYDEESKKFVEAEGAGLNFCEIRLSNLGASYIKENKLVDKYMEFVQW